MITTRPPNGPNYIKGKTVSPPKDEPGFDDCEANDLIVMSWLLNSMEANIMDGLLFVETKDPWTHWLRSMSM
ncbi:hypothetical protein EJ110_NYTH11435 [Nymphaea thermarum]|nr:hypothetical protein EJ110_NYTH11435 [Nymphaea thermarum]